MFNRTASRNRTDRHPRDNAYASALAEAMFAALTLGESGRPDSGRRRHERPR